jgi:uncharacterized protein
MRDTMSLKERITEDMKAAMRAKDAARLLAIRGLLAALRQREIDERIELDDAGVTAIVDKLIKQRKDSIAQFSAAGRTDLVDKETAELRVLEAYLPQRLDAAQIDAEVAAVLTTVGTELGRAAGAADIGKVMALLKARLAGSADMGMGSAAVKKALGR